MFVLLVFVQMLPIYFSKSSQVHKINSLQNIKKKKKSFNEVCVIKSQSKHFCGFYLNSDKPNNNNFAMMKHRLDQKTNSFDFKLFVYVV